MSLTTVIMFIANPSSSQHSLEQGPALVTVMELLSSTVLKFVHMLISCYHTSKLNSVIEDANWIGNVTLATVLIALIKLSGTQ